MHPPPRTNESIYIWDRIPVALVLDASHQSIYWSNVSKISNLRKQISNYLHPLLVAIHIILQLL